MNQSYARPQTWRFFKLANIINKIIIDDTFFSKFCGRYLTWKLDAYKLKFWHFLHTLSLDSDKCLAEITSLSQIETTFAPQPNGRNMIFFPTVNSYKTCHLKKLTLILPKWIWYYEMSIKFTIFTHSHIEHLNFHSP